MLSVGSSVEYGPDRGVAGRLSDHQHRAAAHHHEVHDLGLHLRDHLREEHHRLTRGQCGRLQGGGCILWWARSPGGEAHYQGMYYLSVC